MITITRAIAGAAETHRHIVFSWPCPHTKHNVHDKLFTFIHTALTMKTLTLFCCLSLASLCLMTLIDAFMGDKAEYLNAFSVLQRMFGFEPRAGTSQLARQFGVVAEGLIVLVANLSLGAILTLIVRVVGGR